ncbi:MAG: segregation/condensation protein A [Candidatus Omnitrophica bacterium]|nr:segregation/condensation protein A [Candidatus Omnitrophota bacterium]MBU3933468.1 segregation/condensation protein A [Candidatus Omnitrophota bacterium]MBU4140762.1 segregation/condensation protein A [Candidatus Omnitrophota bacterium]
MSYKVTLEVFEGPLDLLLYLIKRDEIDIYHIPIAKITGQYLEYLDLMQLLDLHLAGEFLVMTSTLMQIKSKMLLPIEERQAEEEEEDPRAELVRKLLEYKKFKQAATRLEELEKVQEQTFRRRVTPGSFSAQETGEGYFEASLFDLISAFSKILKSVPKKQFLEIIKDEFTVEKKVHDLLHLLVIKPAIYFSKLFEKAKNKAEIIATFLAVLELIRLKEIVVRQQHPFSEIQIIRRPGHIKAKSN